MTLFLLMITLLMNNLQMLMFLVLMLHLLRLLIMQILLLGKVYHHTLLINKGRNSSMILDIIFGMTQFFIRRVWIVSLYVVYLSMNNMLLLEIVVIVHMEVIMQEIAQLLRYYNLVFTGLLYLKIVLNMLNHVINVKE
jgi:hypothetical protein